MKRIRKVTEKLTTIVIVLSMLLLQIQPAFADERKVIIAFSNAGEQVQEVQFGIDDSEEDVAERLPAHIASTLSSGEEVSVLVKWKCAGRFDDDYYYYEFIPEVRDSRYVIDLNTWSRDNLPYVLATKSGSDNTDDVKTRSFQESEYNVSGNIQTIYSFLTQNCGFNSAAACGVLANIECESNFNPNVWGDNDTSYGICQWHAGRLTAMQEWCNNNGYNWRTLNGQLNYLKKELSANNSQYLHNGKTINNYLKSKITNSADGAYQAGYYWCTYYEVPADIEGQSISRGNRAKVTYWPMFSREATNTDVVYTTENLNVRSVASTNGIILGTLLKGSSISVQSYNAGWYQVNGSTGYINAAYTSTIPNGTSVASQFSDIKGTEWYLPAVQYMYDAKIMTGTGVSKFSPNSVCTRASMATMMNNLSDYAKEFKLNGKTQKISFADVSAGAWYYVPIRWVVSNGVMSGYGGKNKFGPNDGATREQMVTVLYQYAKLIGKDTSSSSSLSKFSDSASVSSYAETAMKWAVSQQIIQGDGNGHLNPKQNVTRAEVATIIRNFMQMR